MNIRFSIPTLLLFLSLCSGCALHTGPGVSYFNEPLPNAEAFNAAVPRARVTWSGRGNAPDFVVGVSISGGGSRAATFGYSVLKLLDGLGILQHVNVVSGVSGGSLAASYFAMHREDLTHEEGWAEFRKAMGYDFAGAAIRKLFNPFTIAGLLLSDSDRSNLMAQVFDERLFKGRTFGDLEDGSAPSHGRATAPSSEAKPAAQGKPLKPILLINATNTTNFGQRFAFTEEQFDEIGSNLARYPLAHAVMASGAFPLFFDNVTLRDFRPRPPWTEETGARVAIAPRYVHLLDGGPSDNLGLDALREIAQNAAIETLRAEKPFSGCVLISIDAAVDRDAGHATQSDTRSGLGRIVALNAKAAIDALFLARRSSQLAAYRLNVYEDAKRDNLGAQLRLTNHAQFPLFGDVSRSSRTSGLLRATNPRATAYDASKELFERLSKIQCSIWHMPLGGVANFQLDLPVWTTDAKSPRPIRFEPYGPNRELAEKVRRIETHYRLTDGSGRSPESLQDDIHKAAELLVNSGLLLERQTIWNLQQLIKSLDTSRSQAQPRDPERLAE